MKGKRTPADIKAKIIEAKINTNAQGSDIAEVLGVPERTVNNIIQQDFAEVCRESTVVASLIDRNEELMSMADKRLKEMLARGDETIKAGELVSVRESAFKQNQLLQGKATDNVKLSVESLAEAKEVVTKMLK